MAVTMPTKPQCSGIIGHRRTFCTRGFMPYPYQQFTLRLLPVGAAVAGWVIFLPLEERSLSTGRSEFGFKNFLNAIPGRQERFKQLSRVDRGISRQ
jgi:hypothetical protein